jgi:rhamnogalacturonyl hydrolase YesR
MASPHPKGGYAPAGLALETPKTFVNDGSLPPFPAGSHRIMKMTLLNRFSFLLALLCLVTNLPLRAQPAGNTQNILAVMQRVADWQLANPSTHKPTDWTQGAGDAGFMALAGISGNAKYRDAMLSMAETNGWQLGPRQYHADDQCVGQTYAELYLLYRDPKMIAPMREKFDAILAHPSSATSLDFTQPDHQASELWSWCDSLFMAPPAWMRLYAATDDERYMDYAITNWWQTTDYLYDKDEHLFYRDSTYFNKKEANGRKVFWSRGNGWVMAGLVRMLQYLPMNSPARPRFEQLFTDMAAKVLTCRQSDGLWHSSMLDPASYPLKETSGSGFFIYALAWGVNQGLLDRATYGPAVDKGWAALVSCVNPDGKLTCVQPIGSDPKKFDPDSTEIYGVGGFLLAGSEVYRMRVLEKVAANSAQSAETIIPLIEFQDVPLTVVIQNLARQAGINYILDPKIGYGQPDENGRVKLEPTLSVHWVNITPKQALKAVLKNYDLPMTPDMDSDVFGAPEVNSGEGLSRPEIVSVKNPASFRRDCETVELTFRGVTQISSKVVVMDGVSSRILDSQFYSSKTNLAPYKFLFQVDLAPHETRTYYILDASVLAVTPKPVVKTFVYYAPERHDDIAWESDRIAHRMYGPGLETWAKEPLTDSGIDVWIKRTRNLVVRHMYDTAFVFDTNGPSQDDYKVGHTRGCGGLGIWNDGKLYLSRNWHTYKILATGPIRAEFELTYAPWDAGGGRMVSETKRISIDAGSNMSRVESTFSSDDKSPLQLGIGLDERPGENIFVNNDSPEIDSWQNSIAKGLIVQNQDASWMTYWQPQDFYKGVIGTAIVLPKNSIETFTNDNPNLPTAKFAPPKHTLGEGQPGLRSMLAIVPAQISESFVYYIGAGWSESGDFPDAASWNNYVRRFTERRDEPLQVTIGN